MRCVRWRHRTTDAVYNAVLIPFPGTAAGDSRFVGAMATSHLRWRATRHLEFNIDYTRFLAGGTIRDAGGGDTTFFMTSAAFRF